MRFLLPTRAVVALLMLVGPAAGSLAGEELAEPLYLDFLRPPLALAPASDAEMEAAAMATAAAGFTITLRFTGGLTAEQQALFTAAKQRWESRITGYPPGVGLSGLTIEASGTTIDGAGGILGSAGPRYYTVRNGTYYTTTGRMEFDTADIASMMAKGSFDEVVEHEMGHVLGIGIWWSYNGDYETGSGRYVGAAGVGAYRSEWTGQASAGWVPVELEGSSGTANGHWDEGFGGAPTGVHDAAGRDRRYELMTGWLNMPVFYSQTTHQHLRDLGFLVADLDVVFADGFEDGLGAWSAPGQ